MIDGSYARQRRATQRIKEAEAGTPREFYQNGIPLRVFKRCVRLSRRETIGVLKYNSYSLSEVRKVRHLHTGQGCS